MNSVNKGISYIVVVSILGIASLAGLEVAKLLLVIFLFALFFRSSHAAYAGLFFLALIPFLVFMNERKIAEHYAVSAYIFLSGSAIYALARQNSFLEKYFAIKNDQGLGYLILVAIFIFFLFSPGFGYLLINK